MARNLTAVQREAARVLAATAPALMKAARVDPAVFAQFVLRDEETGRPITLAPLHVEWHDVMSKHRRVVITSATEQGKSSQISIARVLWEIGRDPSLRVVIISSTSERAQKLVKALKMYIEKSPEFRAVFPLCLPDKSKTSGRWTAAAFNIIRPTISPNPTVQAVGFEGSLLGARADLIVIDDYLLPETTFSSHMREKGHRWLKAVVEGRKTARCRLWMITNAWHHDDAMARYAKEPATFAKKYGVRDEDGRSRWPAVWPEARIEEEIVNRGPIESQRSMFCNPVADADRRFKESYLTRALQLGDGEILPHALDVEKIPSGWRTITGVDLAASKSESKQGGKTALSTIAVDEVGEMRQILDLWEGSISGPEIIEKIRDVQRRYHSVVWVETNAVQIWLKQFADAKYAMPTRAFNTGKNKHDPHFGIESLAVEIANGKWIFPNTGGTLGGDIPKPVRALIDQMLGYDPLSHTGDLLMATWISREGARKGANKVVVGHRRSRV